MSRRLPLCAWCGRPLRGATVRLLYQIPGRPEVGWHHGGCLDADDVFADLMARRVGDEIGEILRDVLMRIHVRGDGRLVANRAWWPR